MKAIKTSYSTFLLGIALLCLTYFVFQLFYTSYQPLCVDDFWFAHRIYQFNSGLPYRDFSPYKTVLGYYVLLAPMALSHGLIQPLLNTKHFIVLINTAVLFSACWWLRRFFSEASILLTLLLLIFAEFILVYSTNIRVDLLGYWLALFSALCLLEKRSILAGLLLGTGFCFTQKVLWYIVASNAAFGIYWLTSSRDLKTFKNIIWFNAAMLLPLAGYIISWSLLTNLHTVLKSIFYEAYILYQVDVYDSARKTFWAYILINNPLLFLLAPTTLLSLFVKTAKDHNDSKRIFILTYAAVILLCLIPYKQIFPYYMLTAVPAFLLLYAAFFSWMFDVFSQKDNVTILFIGKEGVWALIFLNIMLLLNIFAVFMPPDIYFLIVLVPFALGVAICGLPARIAFLSREAFLPIIMLIILFIGIIDPVVIFFKNRIDVTNHYQRAMVKMTDSLLKEGGDYVAGIELLYNKNQPITGMRHLDAVALKYLYHPSDKIRLSMLDSLYRYPAVSAEQIVDELKSSNVKFYVNNYRMDALPPVIKNYLAAEYEHYWGSIYLYAPTIRTGQQQEEIKFTGNYRLESQNLVYLDNKQYKPYSTIFLTQGVHTSRSSDPYRLKLMPRSGRLADARYLKDSWEIMLY